MPGFAVKRQGVDGALGILLTPTRRFVQSLYKIFQDERLSFSWVGGTTKEVGAWDQSFDHFVERLKNIFLPGMWS